MPEPIQLKRGKDFQRIVQADFNLNNKSGIFCIEQHVSFEDLSKTKQKRGRMDMFIYDNADSFVTILEIKATDWDKIKPDNIKRNLYRHSKQLFNYIDKFMEVDNKDVCHGIIYPAPPESSELKDFIEDYALNKYSFPVYWYSEIKS